MQKMFVPFQLLTISNGEKTSEQANFLAENLLRPVGEKSDECNTSHNGTGIFSVVRGRASKNAFTAPKMHTVTICEILFEKYSFIKMVCLYLWTVSPLKIKMRNFIRNLKSRMKAIQAPYVNVIKASVGTPPQELTFLLDTGRRQRFCLYIEFLHHL